MAGKKIDKRADPLVRHLRRVREGEDSERLFCEGFRLVEELLKSRWPVLEVYATPATEEKAHRLLSGHVTAETPVHVLSEAVMAFASSVESAPGIIAISKKRPPSVTPTEMPLVLVLHELKLPQNVGAILRSAEAAGVSEVYPTKETADPFNPRSIRGSSGSVFRLPIHPSASASDIIGLLKGRGVRLIAATQTGARFHDQVNWARPSALVVGSEGAGFGANDLSLFDETIRIPMAGSVESLNVASATAVCLFEAARQRRNHKGAGQ